MPLFASHAFLAVVMLRQGGCLQLCAVRAADRDHQRPRAGADAGGVGAGGVIGGRVWNSAPSMTGLLDFDRRAGCFFRLLRFSSSVFPTTSYAIRVPNTKGMDMSRITALLVGVVMAVGLVAAPAVAKGPRAPGDASIYDIVESNDDFSTLKFALDTAGLNGVLGSDGVQFTVFAPTNAAFEKAATELGFGGDVLALATFLVENDLLDDVLLYHVTDGRRFSNSVVNQNNPKVIETLLGAFVTSTPAGMIIDAAPSTSNAVIIAADLSASNGVVHVIDNVLVPLNI